MNAFKKLLVIPAAMLMVTLLGGCAEVTTPKLLPATKDPALTKRFAGVLAADASHYEEESPPLYVSFSAKGVGTVKANCWKKGKRRTATLAEFVVVRSKKSDGDSGYISFRWLEKGGSGEQLLGRKYLFGKYKFIGLKKGGGYMLLWFPDPAEFSKAVESGRLKGSQLDNDTILITSPPDDLIDFMDDADNHALFVYEEPIIFRKIKKGMESRKKVLCEKL